MEKETRPRRKRAYAERSIKGKKKVNVSRKVPEQKACQDGSRGRGEHEGRGEVKKRGKRQKD